MRPSASDSTIESAHLRIGQKVLDAGADHG
jgi:hypothetical protein